MLGCARRAEPQTRRPPSIPTSDVRLHGLARVAKAETSPRKREQPPGGNTLHLKSRLDRAPNGLKTTSHSTAGEISGLALVTGHVADRFDRRAVLLVCYAIGVIAAAGLFACAWSGGRQVWPIYALMLLFGATRAFANPAGQALVPNLVPPEHFGNAVAWNSSAWQTATIAGPALGGLLYAVAGSAAFAAATGCFALTFVLFALIRHRTAKVAREKTTWTTLVAGIRSSARSR